MIIAINSTYEQGIYNICDNYADNSNRTCVVFQRSP